MSDSLAGASPVCPKCGAPQHDGPECPFCGVVYAKAAAARAVPELGPPRTPCGAPGARAAVGALPPRAAAPPPGQPPRGAVAEEVLLDALGRCLAAGLAPRDAARACGLAQTTSLRARSLGAGIERGLSLPLALAQAGMLDATERSLTEGLPAWAAGPGLRALVAARRRRHDRAASVGGAGPLAGILALTQLSIVGPVALLGGFGTAALVLLPTLLFGAAYAFLRRAVPPLWAMETSGELLRQVAAALPWLGARLRAREWAEWARWTAAFRAAGLGPHDAARQALGALRLPSLRAALSAALAPAGQDLDGAVAQAGGSAELCLTLRSGEAAGDLASALPEWAAAAEERWAGALRMALRAALLLGLTALLLWTTFQLMNLPLGDLLMPGAAAGAGGVEGIPPELLELLQ